MSVTSAYLRYSEEGQNPAAIADQLRRCRELAAREGLQLEERLVFSDEAITGKSSGIAKRKGYRRLCDAIEARECRYVVADEVSRLTRSMQEGGRLMELVEETGVHFITGCGIDTRKPNWKQQWALKLVIATSEVDGTSFRTKRGMYGTLERGYQIAQAPFGYRAVRDQAGRGKVAGTTWLVHEPEAAIVRQIYQWRYEGMSFGQIAHRLQEMGVQPPGTRRTSSTPHWRQSSVYRLVQNTVYRGVFTWNGSTFTRSRARKRRSEVQAVEFARPDLRLVDDELWHACNPSKNEREGTPRGGGKHVCGGLVRCGECQSLLSVQSGKQNQSLACPSCEQRVRVGAQDQAMGYTSTKAALLALGWVLRTLFTGPVRDEFNKRLADRLVSGPQKELAEVTARLAEVKSRISRIQDLMENPANEPALWEGRLQTSNQEQQKLQHRLGQLRSQQQRLSPEVLQAQVDIDPLPYLGDLLQGAGEVYKTKATLRRLVGKFELVARPRRGISVFRVALRPGVCLAEVTGSAVIDESAVEFEVTTSVGAHRPVVWHVEGHRV